MQSLTELLTSTLGPDGLLLLIVFAAVVLVALGGLAVVMHRDPVAPRMGKLSGAEARADVLLRPKSPEARLEKLADRLGRSVQPKDEESQSAIRRRLNQAGYRAPNAVAMYYAWRVALAFGLPILIATGLSALPGDVRPTILALGAFQAAVAGIYMPLLWLSHRVEKRKEMIQVGFPDALDLLLVCIKAGSSLAAALTRVAGEMSRANSALGEELRIVALEMQAGISREQALRNLAERVATDDVNSLVSLLIQSDALGTSLADSLRIHSEEMRQKRMIRAEEKANKLPVKIVLPLAFTIFPSLMIVVLAPLMIRMYRMLGPGMGDG